MIKSVSRLMRRRSMVLNVVIWVFCAVLIYRLVDIQIISFNKYQTDAINQQTSETPITAKRGMIYDRNMKPLAISATVQRVFISPVDITSDAEADYVAKGLSQILGVDYQHIMDLAAMKNRKDETVMNYVEKAQTDQVQTFIDGSTGYNLNNCIHFAPQSKRYYPYQNLASSVIGFCGTDNTGLFGVEASYNQYLQGVNGMLITAQNAAGMAMPSDYQSYVDAQNGLNVELTIDWTIQNILEKNLEQAYTEAQPNQRVAGIVMNVNTGEVLAMATEPDFNLNSPYTLDAQDQATLDAFKATDSNPADIQNEQSQLLYRMWNNKCISEPYEPGSTYKVMTASAALEEGVVTPDTPFFCPGYYVVSGVRINCHKLAGHGSLTFAEGLQQSCNPVFMMTALKLGAATFMKYYEAFGMKEKTGIDLPGEASGVPFNSGNFGPVELATSAFGQGFKITPIQLMDAFCAVANGGYLLTPHVVKALVDDQGNVVKDFTTQVRRKVISAQTGKTIMSILQQGVATSGSAKNAYVMGYQVAAKTGTSQKLDNPDPNADIGSCIACAPYDNPQIAVMVVIDEPTIGSSLGGILAAPYVANIISDTMSYLGVQPQYTDAEKAKLQKTVPNYVGMKVSDASDSLQNSGFVCTVQGNGTVVTGQVPKVGNTLQVGGTVILYTDNIQINNEVAVPNVVSMTASQANQTIINAGLNLTLSGADNPTASGAIAIDQTPAAGTMVPYGTVVSVTLRFYDGFD